LERRASYQKKLSWGDEGVVTGLTTLWFDKNGSVSVTRAQL